jgi:hypothetical protein
MARKPYDPPFSLRLSFAERARLERDADGTPLGAYIRERLLAVPPRRSRMTPADREALLKLLGTLGQSRLANNVNQLAKAANTGSLPVTPETEAELNAAAADIAAIRYMLVHALGLDASP